MIVMIFENGTGQNTISST